MAKILHILDNLGLGGAQIVVKSILESNSSRHNNILYVLRKTADSITVYSERIYFASSARKFSYPSIRKLKRIIIENEIEIVHCHLFKSVTIGILLKRILKKRISLIIHEHGNILEVDGSSKLTTLSYGMIIRLNKKIISKIISITNLTTKALIEKTKIEKYKIIQLPNFVNLSTFSETKPNEREVQRNIFGFTDSDFVIGFAARLVARKGWEDFIRAAVYLSNDTSYKFLIAGSGEDESKLKKLILSENLIDNVKYIGFFEDMKNFYASLDCFVIPSHWEPMGITELEAQASGIPVVASNVEGLNEIVTDSVDALLFEAQNYEDMAHKIQQLKENPLLKKTLINEGYKNAEKYSLQQNLKILDSIYNNVTINHV